MAWLNIFKKNDSAVLGLSRKIIHSSVLFAEHFKPDLEKKFIKDSKECQQKYIEVLFEFLYFFLQLNDRIGFQDLGHEKRQKLNDAVGPLVIDPIIKNLFDHLPSHLQDSMKKDFYKNLNNAQLDYSKCIALIVKDGEDISYADKIATGAKSRGTINLLADNLMKIIGDHNPISRAQFMVFIVTFLKNAGLNRSILKASKELK